MFFLGRRVALERYHHFEEYVHQVYNFTILLVFSGFRQGAYPVDFFQAVLSQLRDQMLHEGNKVPKVRII
jgi:hypothetical protein